MFEEPTGRKQRVAHTITMMQLATGSARTTAAALEARGARLLRP